MAASTSESASTASGAALFPPLNREETLSIAESTRDNVMLAPDAEKKLPRRQATH